MAGTLLATGSMGSHSMGIVLLDMARCGQAGIIADQFSCGEKKSFTYASEIGKSLTKDTHFDRKEEFQSPNMSH